MNKIFASILLSLVLSLWVPFSIFAEEIILFPGKNLVDLTLIATDPENGSFSFLDNNGESQEGRIGDFIGAEEARVSEVHGISVVVVTYEEYEGDNWDGTSITLTRTNSQTIPMARIIEGRKGVR